MEKRLPERVVVVGGGIAGLATAFELRRRAEQRGYGMRVDVIEAEPWVGGKIRSRGLQGFLVEEAANGWLKGSGAVDALCGALHLESAVVQAHHAARQRFIVHHGKLRELPTNPLKLATSDLLSVGGRFRLAREPFVGVKRGDAEETVAAFGRRRFGKEATELLVDPMVTGVYAGDPERLSVAHCFPKLVALEQTHGSLVKGLMAMQKSASADRVPDARALQSLQHGMSELCEGLRMALGDVVISGRRIVRVERDADRYRLHDADGDTETSDAVVLATPAEATARQLASLDDGLAREIAAIAYNAVTVVALGYRRSDARFTGFGFLAPHREGVRVLGTLVDSNVFDGRAPPDHVLTRTMVGGARRPDLAALSDNAVVALVRQELERLTHMRAEPVLVHVARHPKAIPQYELGHGERLRRIEARRSAHPGLFLTGSAYRGVSVHDCIVDARCTAALIVPD